MNDVVAHPPIASRDEWLASRRELLVAENELTRQYDRINAQRRRLPMVRLEKDYRFAGPDGEVSLRDLLDDQQQLIVYHFMFDPEWDAGCSGCTGFVNSLGDLSMLEDRRTRFALISRAPLEKLNAWKEKQGWSHTWVSSAESDFNYDFHATLDRTVVPLSYNFKSAEDMQAPGTAGATYQGEAHGLSVFFRIDEDVFHTYSVYARGVERLTDAYSLLDVTPYGRQEDFEDSPAGWPQKPTYG